MIDSLSGSCESLRYDPNTGVYRAEFRYGSHPPSHVIGTALAGIVDQEPTDLRPLGEVIDTDALDSLFQPTRTYGHRPDGIVGFDYLGYEITVKSYGPITIRPTAGRESADRGE